MPATEEKVDKTLREVIGDSINAQTQKKSEDKNSQQTQSGEKREFIAGIDVSDIPDNMTKSEFKEFLAKKGKLVDDGATAKYKEIAEYKKERDAITALGVSPQEASKIIRDAITNRNNDTKGDVKKEIRREIDNLKDEAPDAETRRGVERLEKVINELSTDSPAYKELKKDIDDIKKGLGFVQSKTIQTRVESLNDSLNSLKGEKFDGDFIEKYRDKVVELGKQYPDATTRELIKAASTADDYDDALLRTKAKEEKKERSVKEKINATESSSSGVTHSEKDNIDVSKTSWKNLLRHVVTKKK